MKDLKRFYTYAYLREDRTPYYIGKGQTHRAYYKSKSEYVRPPKDKSRIIFLKQNLTEEESFKHEIYMIAVFGRKDIGTGILHNKTDGGDGASGRIESEELKRKKSEMMKGRFLGENNPMYGKSVSQETIKKLKERKGGKNNPMYGKSHSEETKRKQSEARKGKLRSEESRRKQSETIKSKSRSSETKRKQTEVKKEKYAGKNHHMYGKSHSEETKRKQSEIKKGKKYSEETRRKQSEMRKGQNNPNYGTKWWNDGCGNCKMSIECPGKGWVLGVGEENKRKNSESKKKYGIKPPSPKGKNWWNDGKENTKMSVECPGEGWVIGRGKRKKVS